MFIITNLATGGAEMMLLKILQRIHRGRFQVAVISLVDKGEVGPRIEALDIPVFSLGLKRGAVPTPLALFRLVGLLRQLRPDVVHTWMYHADLLGGTLARLSGFRRVIWGIRHSDLSTASNKRSTLFVVRVCALLSTLIPSRILSCSYRARSVHEGIGYHKGKINVIPNGFELDRFIPDATARASFRRELGLPLDCKLVGLVARFDPQKNHLGFIDAAAEVVRHCPDTYFVLAGKDVDHTNGELCAAISERGLVGRMYLLGRRDDVPRLMSALDVLASSSFGEAFPNVLGEAMACGVPCVVTDVGDSAEIVGDTGCVVAPEDMRALGQQLARILQLPSEERHQLGLKARQRVAAEYEIGHVVGLYEAFYESTVDVNE